MCLNKDNSYIDMCTPQNRYPKLLKYILLVDNTGF